MRRSRHIHRDRWISVRADDCVTSSGVEVAPYYVLEYPDWVHVLAIDPEGRIALVRQYRHGLGGFSLELPGGMMDSGDATPLATAARELAEETGVTSCDIRLIASLSPNPATHSNRVHLALARDVAAEGLPSPEPEEDISVEWASRETVMEWALQGSIMNAQHVGLIMIGLAAADRLRR